MIPIFNTYIHPRAEQMVAETLRSTMLSEGAKVRQFEDQLASYLGLVNPVAVNSGSTALQLALMLAGIQSGDEVICPAQTFVATGLAVLQVGAIPVFCDIEYDTGNICCDDLKQRITSKTKAIMPVHWAGYPCDMQRIGELAAQHNLIVIEDAAHALGSSYQSKPIGTISDYTCFSFQAIKHLTTGDGGAVCCLDPDKSREATVRRWFGIDRQNAKPSILGERQYDIELLGFKYHLNDYAASLGLANLAGFKERLEKRSQVAAFYRSQLQAISGIKLFRSEDGYRSANWLFGFHVERRNDFVSALASKGVMASVVHQRIDRNTIFGGKRSDLPNQEAFDASQIHIPLHDAIDAQEAEFIIDVIKQGW